MSESSGHEVEILHNFIVTFEKLPELWDPTNPFYKNKDIRNAAYDKLLDIYIKIKPGATHVQVKRKINTLRSTYRKELKKILTSKSSGSGNDQVYRPTSWVFYALNFLGKYQQPMNLHEERDEIPFDEPELDEKLDVKPQIASLVASTCSSLPPPLPQRERRAIGPLERQNELFQKASSFLDQSRELPDNMPNTVKAWGERLLALDPLQRAFAEKAVNDVLFEASQGTLHRHSVKIKEEYKLKI